MTVLIWVEFVAALWWGSTMIVLVASFIAALAFPRPRRSQTGPAVLPPVTGIVPIKEFEFRFEETQSSLFAQIYPELEVLVATSEVESPASTAALRVQQRFPQVPSRIVRSATDLAVSPKLNNLWVAVAEARNDLILTKDSNVVLAPDDLECFVRHFDAGVGLVSTIPVVTEPESLAAWIEASLINCYYARMLMLARAVGLGFGCGKIMLFRRSDIDRAGGFQSFAWALGEDAALADTMVRLGLRTVLADRVSRQPLGQRRFGDVWERQLRWKSIWRAQKPAVFAGALFGSVLLSALAGAVAAPLAGVAPLPAAAATVGFWFLLETLLCAFRGWPVSLWAPLAFLGREMLDLPVWFCALIGGEVKWAGRTYRPGKRSPPTPFVAEMKAAVRNVGPNDYP